LLQSIIAVTFYQDLACGIVNQYIKNLKNMYKTKQVSIAKAIDNLLQMKNTFRDALNLIPNGVLLIDRAT
jgi:hypothetical protein